MKKIIFIFTIFLSSLVGFNVKALTYNVGKIYEIYYMESKVGIYASDKTYNSMDYNGILVKSTEEDYTFYCAGPEYYLSNYSEATYNSHYVLEGKSSIISNSRLTSDTYDKISLLSYYAYGYKSSGIDHSSLKWYGISQVMMWRILRPDINFAFKTSRYGVTNAPLYDKEVKELNDLVNNHNKIPSFSNKEINLTKGEEITLIDENNVIKNYNISNTSVADFKVIDNKLIITAKENGNVDISLTKPDIDNEFKYYKGIDVQDVVARGDVEKPSTSFKLNITSGILEIKKVDSDTNNFNSNLISSVFSLYDKEDNFIKDIKITKEVETLMLPYGKYYLKEKTASVGYQLNKTLYELDFNDESKLITLVIPNSKIKGDLIIEKYKGGLDEEYVYESNALFEITNVSNNKTFKIKTDSNGIAKITLDYGKYKIVQKEGQEGYAFSKYLDVFIEEVKLYKYEIKNVKKSMVSLLKTDYSSNKPLKDTHLALYSSNNTLIYEGLTNKDGLFIVNNLDIGSYYIKEITPSKYYKLNEEIIPFEVSDNGMLIKLNMTNEKNKGVLNFYKVDKDTKEPIENTKIKIYYLETNELIFEGLTGDDGMVFLEQIEAGNYLIEEVAPAYGYVLNKEKINFEIVNDQEVVDIIMTNEKITMPNTSISYSKRLVIVIICFSVVVLVKSFIKKDE